MNYGCDEMHAHFIKRHEMSLHLFTILAKNTDNVKVMKCPPICTPQRDKNSNSKPGQTKETSAKANPNVNKAIKDRRSGVTADLDPPRSISASGFGPPFADLDPPTKHSFC